MPLEARAARPRLAVVVPTYRQPQFLAEAVLSACAAADDVRVVVVNDGCPLLETHEQASALALSDRRVAYVRRPNGGLSAARNTGIDFVLDSWPTVEALFFLDSDNVLGPGCLSALAEALRTDPTAGFAYTDLRIFGTQWDHWYTASPFSLYRQLFENQCDAGSLVARDPLVKGFRFDEAMRRGYEDWEFFLQLRRAGYRGVHVDDCGFNYRRRGHSMLTSASRDHAEILAHVQTKHADLFSPIALGRLEEEELPRFAIVDIRDDSVTVGTSVRAPIDAVPMTRYLERMVSDGQFPDYVPPVTVFTTTRSRRLLTQLGLLEGLLLTLQLLLRDRPAVAVTLDSAEPDQLQILPDGLPGTPIEEEPVLLYALRSQTLMELVTSAEPRLPGGALTRVKVGIGETHVPCLDLSGATVPVGDPAFLHDHLIEHWPGPELPAAPRPEHPSSYFARHQHVERFDTGPAWVRPQDPDRRDVAIVAPWLRLGGVDRCVLEVARALVQTGRCDVHLVLTQTGDIQAEPELVRWFSTITSVGDLPWEPRLEVLAAICRNTDLILNAHSEAGYAVLPDLRSRVRTRPAVVSYLHLVDEDEFERPCGYVYDAARRDEALIDAYLTVSADLAATVESFGVPREKLHVALNAPTIRLNRMAIEERLDRHRAGPLRVLYAGRLDPQKGVDRLRRIIDGMRDRGLDVEATVIGEHVLRDLDDPLEGADVHRLPSTFDPAALERWFTWADVYLLPSRFEGLPLGLLDAMACGAVAAATDVGAVGEVLSDDVNGVLVDGSLDEDTLVAVFVDRLVRLAANPDERRRLAGAGHQTAEGLRWSTAAEILMEVLDGR